MGPENIAVRSLGFAETGFVKNPMMTPIFLTEDQEESILFGVSLMLFSGYDNAL